MWVDQAKGVLTDNSGKVMRVDVLAIAEKEATRDMWDLLDKVANEPNSPMGIVPTLPILNWQRYASIRCQSRQRCH